MKTDLKEYQNYKKAQFIMREIAENYGFFSEKTAKLLKNIIKESRETIRLTDTQFDYLRIYFMELQSKGELK